MSTIARSSTTRRIHRAISEVASACNAGGRPARGSLTPLTAEQIAKAPDGMFCRKCFPNGKPEQGAAK